ncbi:hypothetical protein Barb4_00605 [Bacteroidales bacterium Barb4]|nr:hypothetical protein Barb4_00605 [Bacteroidales bacterium Barb4]
MYVPVYTPHSAALHVGLKSFALSGHLRNTTFPLHSPTHINPAFPHIPLRCIGIIANAPKGQEISASHEAQRNVGLLVLSARKS